MSYLVGGMLFSQHSTPAHFWYFLSWDYLDFLLRLAKSQINGYSLWPCHTTIMSVTIAANNRKGLSMN